MKDGRERTRKEERRKGENTLIFTADPTDTHYCPRKRASFIYMGLNRFLKMVKARGICVRVVV